MKLTKRDIKIIKLWKKADDKKLGLLPSDKRYIVEQFNELYAKHPHEVARYFDN